MSKARVYEVAKQVGIDNRELVTMLPKLGIEGKSHMGSLSDEEVDIVLKFYRKGKYVDEPRKVDIEPKHHVNEVKPHVQPAPKPVVKHVDRPMQQSHNIQSHSTGNQNTGSHNTGSQNSGSYSTGSQNSGSYSTGSQNSGSHNTGSQNSGSHSTGSHQTRNNSTGGYNSGNQGSGTHKDQSYNNRPSNNGTYNSGNQRPAQANQGQRVETRQGDGRPNTQTPNQNRNNYQQRPQARPVTPGTGSGTGGSSPIQRKPAYSNNQPQQGSRTTGAPRPFERNDDKGPVKTFAKDGDRNNQPKFTKDNDRSNQPKTAKVDDRNNQTRFAKDTTAPRTSKDTKPTGKPQGQKSAVPNLEQKVRNTGAKYSAQKAASKQVEPVILSEEDELIVKIPDIISVKDLAVMVRKQSSDIIKILFMKKIMATANQEIPYDMAKAIAEELGFLVDKALEEDIVETFFQEEEDSEDNLQPRPPIVVVMGHVDHGKTSLLDAIRNSKVAAGEHGGITQHIGASVVTLNGQKITFLDTPGHEAFTAMRLRGAMATDIAILVVAADDGVMPQTIEAINHAKAAGVQIIVAVNKVDKAGANPDRVKQELVEYQLIAEDWGGETVCVNVSAHTGENIDHLLEMILLVAEMENLKANPNKRARGVVIEAQLDKGRGPVATVLVQNGTLRVGDAIVAGASYGRIRAMMDDKGRRVKVATPSTPVEVLGLSEVPLAGEAFFTAENEKEARMVSERVNAKNREKLIGHTPHKVTLDDIFTQIQAGSMKELKIIIKADVQGSVEAMKQSLSKLSNEKVVINVIHGGVGAINESDVMLATASSAIIIGFNVRPEAQAKITADAEEIDMRLYRVIYNAIEDIEAAMKGMLDPEYREKIIGHAQIRQIFKVSGVGTIAGAYVLDGKLVRNAKVRLLRDNIVVYEGDLDSLKRFKDDAKEVNSGYECGFTLTKFNDIKEEDVIEAFIMEEIPR